MEHKKLQDYVDSRITGEWGIEAQNNEDDVYVIRTADFVNDGTIDYTKVVKRNIAKNKIVKKKLRYGDIIVEKSGGTNINPVGRVVFFDNNKCNYLSNNFTETLRIKDEYIPKYIFYCLKYKYSNGSTIKMFNKTTGIQNLKMDLFLNQYIPFVNKAEQQRVVDILDRIFKMISNKKHEIEKMNDLIKSQFVDMFQSGKYPKEELGKICDVRDGTHDSPKYLEKSEYKFITSKNIINDRIDFSEVKYISKEDYNKYNSRSKVNYGDILMPMIGTIGNPIIVSIPDNEIDFAIKNVALIKFLDNSKVTNIYIKNLFNSDYFENAISQSKRGGTQKFIALSDIRKLKIEIPPMDAQNKFSKVVKQIDKQKFVVMKILSYVSKIRYL